MRAAKVLWQRVIATTAAYGLHDIANDEHGDYIRRRGWAYFVQMWDPDACVPLFIASSPYLQTYSKDLKAGSILLPMLVVSKHPLAVDFIDLIILHICLERCQTSY
jgi:hypothetical protein